MLTGQVSLWVDRFQKVEELCRDLSREECKPLRVAHRTGPLREGLGEVRDKALGRRIWASEEPRAVLQQWWLQELSEEGPALCHTLSRDNIVPLRKN